jgi:hypothetical protein
VTILHVSLSFAFPRHENLYRIAGRDCRIADHLAE